MQYMGKCHCYIYLWLVSGDILIDVSKRLGECDKTLGIEVLDHVIVNADAEYYSMKEKGHI